nr:hypothetical protein Iba_chr08aCG9990 [Ipomoea batatas]
MCILLRLAPRTGDRFSHVFHAGQSSIKDWKINLGTPILRSKPLPATLPQGVYECHPHSSKRALLKRESQSIASAWNVTGRKEYLKDQGYDNLQQGRRLHYPSFSKLSRLPDFHYSSFQDSDDSDRNYWPYFTIGVNHCPSLPS